MADMTGLELARPGKWDLSTGPLDVTEKMLADAAAYAARPEARPVPVRLGHHDPRFDGEPALGWLTNLRVDAAEDGDGKVLLGDVLGMPEWLASIMATSYPDRSVEGWTDHEEGGRTYGLVLDGMALLGVTPPGMSTIRSLRDLPQALGVAAGARIVATIRAAAVSDTPWSQFSNSDYTDEQYARACILDRGPDAGTAKQRYSLPVREPSGALNRNGCHAAAAALAGGRGGVSASPEQIAAAKRKLASLYRNQLGETPPDSLSASADPQIPAASASGQPNPGSEVAVVAFSDESANTLRQKLGVAEGADEATILAALDEALAERAGTDPDPAPQPEPQPAPQPQPNPPPTPQVATPQPVAAAGAQPVAGTMMIDATAWQEREARIKRLEAADSRRRVAERDQVIRAAVGDGKFPLARTEHWVRLWDADPEGTRTVIAGLARNVVPVDPIGSPGDPDGDSIDQEFAHLFPPVTKGA